MLCSRPCTCQGTCSLQVRQQHRRQIARLGSNGWRQLGMARHGEAASMLLCPPGENLPAACRSSLPVPLFMPRASRPPITMVVPILQRTHSSRTNHKYFRMKICRQRKHPACMMMRSGSQGAKRPLCAHASSANAAGLPPTCNVLWRAGWLAARLTSGYTRAHEMQRACSLAKSQRKRFIGKQACHNTKPWEATDTMQKG